MHGAWEKDEMGDFNVPRGRLDYMWEIVGSHESGIWSPAATPLTLFLTPPCLITFAGRRGSDAVIKPDLLSGQNSTRLPTEKKPLELYCTNLKQSIGENFHPSSFPEKPWLTAPHLKKSASPGKLAAFSSDSSGSLPL